MVVPMMDASDEEGELETVASNKDVDAHRKTRAEREAQLKQMMESDGELATVYLHRFTDVSCR